MQIKIATTTEDKKAMYGVRKIVFVDEQHVPLELEIDEYEDTAIHFICHVNEHPTGAGRLRLFSDYGKLERIAVLKSYRGQSIGRHIIQRMEEEILINGIQQAKLNAQTHATAFYQSLGYEVVSGEFMDAGIPHVTMVKKLST